MRLTAEQKRRYGEARILPQMTLKAGKVIPLEIQEVQLKQSNPFAFA
jgi:O-acetyl-ADP-ribose deacetylase (regulator of RNase III)